MEWSEDWCASLKNKARCQKDITGKLPDISRATLPSLDASGDSPLRCAACSPEEETKRGCTAAQKNDPEELEWSEGWCATLKTRPSCRSAIVEQFSDTACYSGPVSPAGNGTISDPSSVISSSPSSGDEVKTENRAANHERRAPNFNTFVRVTRSRFAANPSKYMPPLRGPSTSQADISADPDFLLWHDSLHKHKEYLNLCIAEDISRLVLIRPLFEPRPMLHSFNLHLMGDIMERTVAFSLRTAEDMVHLIDASCKHRKQSQGVAPLAVLSLADDLWQCFHGELQDLLPETPDPKAVFTFIARMALSMQAYGMGRNLLELSYSSDEGIGVKVTQPVLPGR